VKNHTRYKKFKRRIRDTQTTEPIKYFLYCRKSSEGREKQAQSIGRQETWGLQEASQNNHLIEGIFREEKSASTPYQRQDFDDLVRKIKRGEGRGIYAWKLDRLARNPEEAGIIMGLLARGEIFHIVTSQREYRPKDNAIISYVDFGMADQYSRDLSTNVTHGLHNKAAQGVYPGRACLGYLNTKFREKGKNEIIVDPERFDKTQQVLQRLLTGKYSVPEVIDFGENELHLTAPASGNLPERPMSRSGWYRFFANPLPSGWYEYPKGSGNWVEGNHKPMITPEELERIQMILGKSGKPRGIKRQHIYPGLIHCGSCPAMVTAEEKVKRQKNGTVHFYTYYHCTKRIRPDCPERSIEIKELEKQVAERLATISISDEFREWAVSMLEIIDAKDAQNLEAKRDSKKKALAKVDRQLENLTLKFTSLENTTGELFSDQEYLELKRRFQKQRISIERGINASDEGAIEEANRETKETFEFANFAHGHFIEGGGEAKRDILARVGSNRTLKGKKVLITLTKPLKSISDSREMVEREISQVRTAKNVENKRHIPELATMCPTLRGVVDEVRTYFLE